MAGVKTTEEQIADMMAEIQMMKDYRIKEKDDEVKKMDDMKVERANDNDEMEKMKVLIQEAKSAIVDVNESEQKEELKKEADKKIKDAWRSRTDECEIQYISMGSHLIL